MVIWFVLNFGSYNWKRVFMVIQLRIVNKEGISGRGMSVVLMDFLSRCKQMGYVRQYC